MAEEQIFFHMGLAGDTRSALQKPGFLKTFINMDMGIEGDQKLRQSFAALNATALSYYIHSIRRFEGFVLAGYDGALARAVPGTGAFTGIFSSPTGIQNEKWRWREYKRFLHGVNGYEEVLFDEYGNLYPAKIENPATKCAGAAGAAGNPSGHYMLYCSYYITWPNGMVYETGLSPVSADVDVTSTIITWTVPVCPYVQYTSQWSFNKDMLILDGNAAIGSSSILDLTGRNTVTVTGPVVAGVKFSHKLPWSIYFDGTNDYLSIADSADWNMGTGAVSIDGHVMLETLPASSHGYYFFNQGVDANNAVSGYIVNNGGVYTLGMKVANTGTIHEFSIPFSPVINTEYHIAFIRGWGGATNTDAGWAITINGTAGTNTVTTSNPTVTWPDLAAPMLIGVLGTDYFKGWMGDWRIRKGEAFWAANFAGTVNYPNEPTVNISIKRKLYRGPGTGGTLADIYYVGTIHDNSTTSYSDNLTDAALAAQGSCAVQDYGPGPHSKFIEYHYGRLNLIDIDHPWRHYYSEAAGGDTAEENENIMPLAFTQDNYDDLRVAGFEKTDPMGLVAWGTNYYVAFKQMWLRRQGNDPDTWSWKKTWARHGVCASDTISKHRLGVFYLTTNEGRQTGIALFNGQTSELITSPKLDYIFNDDLAPEHASTAIGACIGNFYHLLYQNSSHVWKWLALDLRRYPDVRAAYWEKAASTELMPNQVDRDLSGASAWTNIDLSSYDETGDLSITASGIGQYCKIAIASAPTEVGKIYRIRMDVDNLVGTWTVKDYTGAQTLGTVSAEGRGQEITFTASTTGGLRLVAVAATSSGDFDNFSLIEDADDARCLDAYSQGYDETNALSFLVGGSNGRVYYDTATAQTMNFEAETHNLIGGDPRLSNKLKVLKELKYNLDSNGEPVKVEIYIDGTLATWPDSSTSFEITGTTDTVQVKRDFPPNFEGYQFRIKLTSAGISDLRIYSPWTIEWSLKGM